MIKSVHAVAAEVTMKNSLRSYHFARVTELHPCQMCTSIAYYQCPPRCGVLSPSLFHVNQSSSPQILNYDSNNLTALGIIPGLVITVQIKAMFVIKLEAMSTNETIIVFMS